MKPVKLTEKINNVKGLVMSVVSILAISFMLHDWLSTNFVTKEHFDNSIAGIQTQLDTQISKRMDDQFLILKKNIDETQYQVLGVQIADIRVKDKFALRPLELDSITKMVRRHCMLGISLGYMNEATTDCEKMVDRKLAGG